MNTVFVNVSHNHTGIKKLADAIAFLLVLALLLTFLFITPAHAEGFSPNPNYEYIVGGTVWQLSAESQAMMRQSFAAARGRIAELALKCIDPDCPDWAYTNLPNGTKRMTYQGRYVAVITDIDDTLVDGAHYTANIVGANGDYNNAAFTRFVLSDGCSALPGAVEFTNFCVDNGVEVYYVTNRYDQGYKIGQSDSLGGYPKEGGGLYIGLDKNEIGTTTYQVFGMSMYDITLKRMLEMGFPIDESHLLLHDGKVFGQTKEPYREAIREGADDFPNGQRTDGNATDCDATICLEPHHVVLLLGDQLSDFTDDFDAENLDAISRAELINEYADKWGTEWIVLPNAVYGKAFDHALAYGIPQLLHDFDYTSSFEAE